MPRRLILVTAAIVLWNTVYLERAASVSVDTVKQSMTPCCNTCHRWAGSASTSPVIISGAATLKSARANSGR